MEIWITPFHVSLVSLNLLGSDLFSSFLNRIISCSQTWLCLSMNKALFCLQCTKPGPRTDWYSATFAQSPPTPSSYNGPLKTPLGLPAPVLGHPIKKTGFWKIWSVLIYPLLLNHQAHRYSFNVSVNLQYNDTYNAMESLQVVRSQLYKYQGNKQNLPFLSGALGYRCMNSPRALDLKELFMFCLQEASLGMMSTNHRVDSMRYFLCTKCAFCE